MDAMEAARDAIQPLHCAQCGREPFVRPMAWGRCDVSAPPRMTYDVECMNCRGLAPPLSYPDYRDAVIAWNAQQRRATRREA